MNDERRKELIEQAKDFFTASDDYGFVIPKTSLPPKVLYFMADFAESLLPKWTYCEDALPERYDDYLITLANQSVCRAAYSTFSNDWMIPGIGWASDENPVIAWQPLPAPAEPKEA